MSTLIADSGSTKTDWLLASPDSTKLRMLTRGINPIVMSDDEIAHVIQNDLLPQIASTHVDISAVRFYGAGCLVTERSRVADLLRPFFPSAEINVDSDLLCAARALCGKTPGIACILGTGSNSCLYDGQRIIENTPALGFILGDEGSGATLGRILIGKIFKHQFSPNLEESFSSETGETITDVIRQVYKGAAPNRYLAGFTHFIAAHRTTPSIHALLVNEFRRFFVHNISPYANACKLPVHFVGGIASTFAEELNEAATAEGYLIGKIIRHPLDCSEHL